MRALVIGLLTLFFLGLVSCDMRTYEEAKEDSSFDFCSSYQVQDLYRIPLLYPYELTSASYGYSWHFDGIVDFKGDYSSFSLSSIIEVNVKAPYIFLHSTNVFITGDGQVDAFIICNTKTDSAIIIKASELNDHSPLEFSNSYLPDYDMPLIPIKDINDGFRTNSKLPWHCESNE
ncbi:hypothetical protein [Parvicella tangerina]|uniref:Lipoprotein n=1 Tax=Parvicella tangerina TaxID=2829795 RepID=A0A916JQ44_9FLAO|nr:hypothetical protein [Parvicella tangerina]CAG5085317.1 hypothetical protein CRYO30217_02723 [Parvicella tangerina]